MNLLRQFKYKVQIKWIIKRFVLLFLIAFAFYIVLNISGFKLGRTENDVQASSKFKSNPQELHKVLKDEVSNIPIDVYEQYYNKSKGYKCTSYPHILDLEYQNTHWQRFKPVSDRSDITIDMFSAYYDNRPRATYPSVRIISAINVANPEFKISCQMWFKNHYYVKITKVSRYTRLWDQTYINVTDGIYIGYIIKCPLPDYIDEAPLSVSLVREECDQATNNLRVQNHRPVNDTKKDFLVCVKGLDFPVDDVSLQLIQFFEANFMFGVDKIVLYDLQISDQNRKVINYYVDRGKAELLPISLPGNYPNLPLLRHLMWYERELNSMLNEVIPYNDCFYKNLYKYKYIMLLDTDEIFVPVHETNYKSMLAKLPKGMKHSSTYYSRNKMFVRTSNLTNKNFPESLYMLQITTVATNYGKLLKNPKAFFKTTEVVALNNHLPYACFNECLNTKIPRDLGQLHHYRPGQLVGGRYRRTQGYHVVNNISFLRFKEKFINATNKVLKYLEYK